MWHRILFLFYYHNITHSAFGISFKINSEISSKNILYFSKPKKKKKKMGYFQSVFFSKENKQK